MKRTKDEIEAAKAAHMKRMGRPPKGENTVRLTIRMVEDVEARMREHVRRNRDTLSGYLTRLVERDLEQGSK